MFRTHPVDLVEVYPVRFYETNDLSFFNVLGKRFTTRTIFRPNNGMDVLMELFIEEDPVYSCSHSFVPTDKEVEDGSLTRRIKAHQPASDLRVQQDFLTVDYERSWEKVADSVNWFVNTLANSTTFNILCHEAFGKLYIMRESDGWALGKPLPPVDEITNCALCEPENMMVTQVFGDAGPCSELMRLTCKHAYHKDCLLSWLWRNSDPGALNCILNHALPCFSCDEEEKRRLEYPSDEEEDKDSECASDD